MPGTTSSTSQPDQAVQVEIKPPTPAPRAIAKAAPVARAMPALDATEIWQRVTEQLNTKATLRAAFENAELVDLSDDRALIRLHEHEQLEYARLNADVLGEMFKKAAGRRLRIALEAPAPNGSARLNTTEITPELKKDAESNPLVRRAIELFDARVVRVEDREQLPGNPTKEETDDRCSTR